MRSPRLLFLGAAALLLAVPAAGQTSACGLLGSVQIYGITNDPVTHSSGVPTDCIWSGKKSRVYITTRDSSAWPNGKSAFQTRGHITPIAGLGEEAFFAGPDASPTVYALKGTRFIILRLNVTGFSPAQTKGGLQALANEALAHM